ncbi:BnaA07g28440D [Brassica napus]|uniref:BnaA07g28440D protein n=1 Tax=Brassica napus TaxID=3708 RepID=A0A078HLL2_BRANA|nr:BnaA07g28440D [Brassica napus]
MELFTRGSAVRLRSCHENYLFAVDDEKAVRQSSDGTSRQSVWTVEMVPRKPNFIRLKSCYGKYLTASESSFFLGVTGHKVVQTPPFRQAEHESNWEPIRDELPVKLMSWNGTYLRGNGGSPPWKNSVTHDHEPHVHKKWILWTVEVVENPENVSFADGFSSPASSFNSAVNDESSVKESPTFGSSESIGSDPVSVSASKLMFTPSMSETSTPKPTEKKDSTKFDEYSSAIDIFRIAKSVRLRSNVHEKYLIADDNEESVVMGRNGSAKEARWRVELVPGSGVIRLKSCHGGYLTASNERMMLRATGHKVVQSRRTGDGDPAGEWKPVTDGSKVKLKSRNGGNFLRANGGMPPWRNSVTHDIPNRSATQDCVVWEVDVVEIMERSHETG